ncbi:uncharacterized protein EDB93DRAFT_1123092 [Suillus bovinus]|uniref:uncharacterized protein n=1 Tax=Suillus bovinus TaxID=48563 RepID=UPI001B86B3B8|nr:uncharacterized protein EDB93DRAFT_1123092 [Suillus bovinus]KAG2158132.1 hypothetical protein EDB93DRAFT_1123092 [Suillus bovinus]
MRQHFIYRLPCDRPLLLATRAMTIPTSPTVTMSESVNSDPQLEVPDNCRAPNNPILRSAFTMLCIIAVSRENLHHWKDTTKKDWKEHVSIMVNRFQNTNVTAGLVLATTAMFLSSVNPIEHMMAYNSSISYIFAMVSFGAALLSVISGSAVLIIYETSTAHKDMETLRHMPRHHVIALLLWMAYPSICLSIATCFLFVSVFIACFWSDNGVVNIITILGCVAFLSNGGLTLYVFGVVGKKPIHDGKKHPHTSC